VKSGLLTVPSFRRVAAGVSPRRLGFDPWSVPCHLWQTEWQCDRILSEYVGFPLSASFHPSSILIFIYTLLLPEGKLGEAWEPSQNQPYFGNPGAVGRKMLLYFSYLNN